MTDSAATRLICPLTASSVKQMRKDMLFAVEAGADTIEVRLDMLDSIPDDAQLHTLLDDAPVDIIATARPRREGGNFAECNEGPRLDLLKRAGKFDSVVFVDVEMDVPCKNWPVPPEKVILSHHDFEKVPENLHEIIEQMESSQARINKIAFAAAGPQDAVLTADIINSCKKL